MKSPGAHSISRVDNAENKVSGLEDKVALGHHKKSKSKNYGYRRIPCHRQVRYLQENFLF